MPLTTPAGHSATPVTIPTANPISFHQAISEQAGMAAASIRGHLFLPAGDAPCPTVIVVPGSVGIAENHIAKVDQLLPQGFAVCVIDPFGERGVTSTVANQAQYTFAASAWDVLATVRVLADNPAIDSTRIGAQGHSRGGAAVLQAACMAQIPGVHTSAPLAGVYAAYPWCGQQFERPAVGNTRVRAIIGALDDWCLPQQVQAYIQAMVLCGGDASWRIVADAHHGFDRSAEVHRIPEASVAPSAPTTYLRADGAMRHPLADAADPALTERELMRYGVRSGRGVIGATMGSSHAQAAVFEADTVAFWRETLRP